ncbi:hypothetical protein [Alteromonas facilis]|uniref:hypothetical protein n=1 Tax=Alteromonas facilis TaxID=2048004 RepID=UPI000C2906EB|nr:hypothetical protein [Alteromonas facilis]
MKPLNNEPYFALVNDIIEQISAEDSNTRSALDDVTQYFLNDARSAKKQLELKVQIATLQDEASLSNEQHAELDSLIGDLNDIKQQDDTDRHQRLKRVRNLCQAIYECCEGKSLEESKQKTAKFLASLWLLSEQYSGSVQAFHQRIKTPYKMALTLRLVDEVIHNKLLRVPNWDRFADPEIRFHGTEEQRQSWYALVAVPAMTAALFQDAGLHHPLAKKLLQGSNKSKDPFRVLDNDERTSLLKMNYRFSVDYVTTGLGADYGTTYATPETQILAHATQIELVKDAYKPATGIGELLKIPQIYASVVFSTKHEFTRTEVPKGCMLIDQLGKKGVLNVDLANAFNSIVGAFPQGYGLLSNDAKCMVLGLYPHKMHEPHVLALLSPKDELLDEPAYSLSKNANFYFASTRDQFSAQQPHEAGEQNDAPPIQGTWMASQEFAKWSSRWA